MPTRTLDGGLQSGANFNVDFYYLINDVADTFQSRHATQVTEAARQLLITPALPYKQRVERELAEGEITLNFLRDSIRTVLENAREISEDMNQYRIDTNHIQLSMKMYCPYLFWC